MPTCYFLAACGGSSVDQQSNNLSLFSLVEQVSVHPRFSQPPTQPIPLEVHAYWQLEPHEIQREFETRIVLVASTGLETPSAVHTHRAVTPRFRVRARGIHSPPVFGDYTLRVDWRWPTAEGAADAQWQRESACWPIAIGRVEIPEQRPTTH